MPPILFVILLAILVYLPAIRNQFVYDDYLIIAKNPNITSLEFLKATPTSEYFNMSGEASYRPVASLSYFIVAVIFGMSPLAFHLSSILLHAGVTALVLLLARRIGMGPRSVWPAAAFAVHPLLSEAVCSINYSEDLLVTFFILVAVLTAAHSTLAFWKRITITAAASALACLSKESGVVSLPLIGLSFLALKHIPLSRRQTAIMLVTVAGIVAGFIFVRFGLLPGIPQAVKYIGDSPVQIILNSSLILIRYTGRMIFPLTLLADRIPDLPQTLADWRIWTALTGHMGLLFITALSWRHTRTVSFGIVWFYIGIAPTSNLLAMSCPEADRYLYLAGIGLLIAGFAGAHKATERWPAFKKGVMIGSICLISLWAVRTGLRVPQWHDNLSLWSHEAESNPLNDKALTELAVHANSRGLHKDAAQLAGKALLINPANQLARLQSAKANHAAGDYHKAMSLYKEVIASETLHPHLQSDAWLNYGILMEDHLDNNEEAELAYIEAVKCAPSVTAFIRHGVLMAQKGQLSEAVRIWRQALLRHPDNPVLKANINLAEQQLLTTPRAP